MQQHREPGCAFDEAALEAFIASANLFIAHNAGFDQTFCERLARGFADRPWVCSVREIDWSSLGVRGSKLEYLLAGAGWFHDAHRATGVTNVIELGAGNGLARLMRDAIPDADVYSLSEFRSSTGFQTWVEKLSR